MLLGKLVGERTKDTPQDARIKSHVLLARAGYIKQVAGGIFSMTTPCRKMSGKIENIVREEMNKIDGQEVLLPVVMPRELWEQSGRYDSIGSEMVRFKDRNERDMLLGMTHEEAAVHLVNHTVTGYSQLPLMIYQIQTKFRDEARPRGGLIRVREFTMKDAYSFHATQEDLDAYYKRVYDAYYRIFRRIGLKNFIDVKSDTGMMGGSVAHEYMLLTEVGEDSIVLCHDCDYRANMEVAQSVLPTTPQFDDAPLQLVDTGADKTIEEVCARLKVEPYRTVKAVLYAVKGDAARTVAAFVRGDLEVNEAKLKRAVGLEVAAYEGGATDGLVCGNIGPMSLPNEVTVILDKSLQDCKNVVTGANKVGFHYTGFSPKRDFPDGVYADISKAREGDVCPVCGGKLYINNGIEIGNIFQLGTKYTASMGMSVTGADGTRFNPIMGCYGIGIGRAIASVAQESNDDKGLILPMPIAPWQVHLCGLRLDDAAVAEATWKVYDELTRAGVEVLFDERNVGAGVKFADADLMGMPIRIVVSPKTLADGEYELTMRESKESCRAPLGGCAEKVRGIIADEMKRYN